MTNFKTSDRDVDRAIRSWLHEDRHEDASRLAGAVLDQVDTTPQRRATWWPARRTYSMHKIGAIGLAAAAVLVAAVVGTQLLGVPRGGLGSMATPTPAPTTAIDFPALTNTFVSPRNGFSISHPEGAAITPAEQLWGLSQQDDDGLDVLETGLGAVFMGASTQFMNVDQCFDSESQPISCGSIDERIDGYVSDGGCGVPRSEQEEITIDGRPARVAECPDHIEATVLYGGRIYLFTLEHDRDDARAVFDAFVATIELTPGTAVDFPALTETFVSPTYGYSFGYIRGIAPATQVWDPVNWQVDDNENRFDERFDAVETGLGAYFGAASATIPDGVSIDEWVDEYVSPGGCGVPRSQQAEITIDGQPGRIAECPNQIEATVVAGGRLYLFALFHTRTDARAFFDSWVETIDLTPETATVP